MLKKMKKRKQLTSNKPKSRLQLIKENKKLEMDIKKLVMENEMTTKIKIDDPEYVLKMLKNEAYEELEKRFDIDVLNTHEIRSMYNIDDVLDNWDTFKEAIMRENYEFDHPELYETVINMETTFNEIVDAYNEKVNFVKYPEEWSEGDQLPIGTKLISKQKASDGVNNINIIVDSSWDNDKNDYIYELDNEEILTDDLLFTYFDLK